MIVIQTKGSKHRWVGRLSVFGTPLLVVLFLGLCGCAILGYIPPERLAYDKLSAGYRQTKLKKSSTLDLVGMFRSPQYGYDANMVGIELFNQSDTIIASTGQSKSGHKTWFNLVAFEEHTMTAERRYFFCMDEKAEIAPTEPKRYVVPPRKAILFDGEIVLQQELLRQPYATEQAKLLAILKQFPENLKKDISDVIGSSGESGQENKILAVSGMLMNQAFEAALLELNESFALAQKLSSEKGVAFSHITLKKGRIRMTVRDDIATVRIRIGLPL